ncbi:iron-containing alcohol dehydrogenase [Actinomadura sp. GC306]|nr:iron-containing alcohol dehydrogenase [Actinomadura sp. GC306]
MARLHDRLPPPHPPPRPVRLPRGAGAAPHTPVAVTAEAMAVVGEAGADCVVAIGGGSAIGLAKAVVAGARSRAAAPGRDGDGGYGV